MRDGNMQYRFFIGKPRNGCSLTAEEMGLRDIVVLREADDGYENLVDKVTTTMRWISQNVVAEVALKVDDDVFVSLPSILKRYMHFRTNYMDRRGRVSRLYMGAVTPFGLPATRYKHKWYLPSSQYSQPKLPTYCNGPAYMVSLDMNVSENTVGPYDQISGIRAYLLKAGSWNSFRTTYKNT